MMKATNFLLLFLLAPLVLHSETWFHRRFEMSGNSTSAGFGISTLGTGDFDGDGHNDVAVGEYRYVIVSDTTGAAYLFFGGHAQDCIVFSGTQNGEKFGYTVESAGDFNGDGYDDLLISAPDWSEVYPREGRVLLYYGGGEMDSEADLVFTLPVESGRFGTSIAGIGDINGDDFDDFIIGSPYAYNMAGLFAIYLGAQNPDVIPDCIVQNEDLLMGRLGFSASSIGDVNADGLSDYAVCMAPKRLTPTLEKRTGEAWIYFGGTGIPESPDLVFKGVTTSQLYGFSVRGAGDFDGDGIGDVMVGAPRINSFPPIPDSLFNNGAVFIYSGGTPPDTTVDLILFGEEEFDGFGSALYPAGDLNDDDFDDIVVGAPENDAGEFNAGACYFFLGNEWYGCVLLEKLMGQRRGAQFGYCLSTVERIVGNRSNFLIGSPGQNSGFLYESFDILSIGIHD